MLNEEKAQFSRSLLKDIEQNLIASQQRAELAGGLDKAGHEYFKQAYKAIDKANIALLDLNYILEGK